MVSMEKMEKNKNTHVDQLEDLMESLKNNQILGVILFLLGM